MEDYLIGIGKRIKEIRKENKKTITEIASDANVTGGLISRIENGRTIPSLPVFLKILKALQIEASAFFEGIPQAQGGHYIVCRKEDNSVIEKEDEAFGFSYHFIFGKQLTSMGFETVLLEVAPNAKREKVVTDAFELKYVLSGECHYLIGNEEIFLKEGDTLFFDGRIPHVPQNKGENSCKMLVVYFFI